MKRFLPALLQTLVLAIGSPLAAAQDYPSKPIMMLVPFPPGGSTEVLGRVLAQSMSELLKQQVILETVGGAGGTIGAARAAKAAPNGYTILFHNMAQASAPALYRKLPYDPVADFEPIGLVTDVPMILVARKDFPPKDVKELLAYLKANKDKVTFANAGVGATSHMCGILFMNAIQTDLTTVPYKGTGPALNDLMGGQVDLLCDQPAATSSHVKSGRIKAYAVATKARVPSLPDVPTFAESGLPGFELVVWHGLYAPKGTPKPIIEKLAATLQQALKDPALAQRFADLGTEPIAQNRATPDALRIYLKSEVDRWGPLIKKAGVYAD